MEQDKFRKNSINDLPLPKAPTPQPKINNIPTPEPNNGNNNSKNIMIGFLAAAVLGMGIYIATGGNSSSNGDSVNSNKSSSATITTTNKTIETSSVSSNNVVRTGVLNGDEVIIRSRATTNSDVVTYLNRGTRVTVLEQLAGNDNSSAVLDEDRYITLNGSRIRLNKGLAVKVVENRGDNVVCQIGLSNGIHRIVTPKYSVRYIGGDTWFHVRLNNGKTGYVYGKYLQVN